MAAPPAPPPLTLVPLELARAALVATMVAPTLDRALESGVALARKAAPLPLDAAAVREMAFGQMGVPPEIQSQLDLASPVSGAMVGFGHNDPIKAAFAFNVKPGVDVARFLGSIGTVVERRGPVLVIDTRSSGRGWFLPVGNVIVFADSELGLVQAANLALDARRGTVKDDVSVIVHPDGLARASGTDVKTASERLLNEIDERSAANGNKLGPEARVQLHELIGYAEDLATVEFALDLSADKGVALLARLHAKPASKLEGVSRGVATVPIDPALFGKDEAGVVVTSAYAERTLEQLRRQRSRLPEKGGKDVVAAGNLMDALANGLTGTLSMVGRFQPGLSLEIIYPLKDATSAAKLQTALLASDRASVVAMLRAETTGTGVDMKVLKAQKENIGKLHATHWTLAFTMAGDTLGIIKKLIGKGGLDIYGAIVGGDRLAFTMGPGAKARLLAIGAGPKGSTPKDSAKGNLVEATALEGGRSLYYYIDLRDAFGLATTLGGASADPRLKMVAGMLKTTMPVLGGVTGDASGRQLTIDLTIPPSCIAGIGGLVMGMMGGGAPPLGASSMK
ncbi:MAG TPA: hypothetical protein VGP07_13550 [Polyangia bacterium]